MIGLDDVIVYMEFFNVKNIFTYNPHIEQGFARNHNDILVVEMFFMESKANGYHLIFDLNEVLNGNKGGSKQILTSDFAT
jgi:hypothetical protein